MELTFQVASRTASLSASGRHRLHVPHHPAHEPRPTRRSSGPFGPGSSRPSDVDRDVAPGGDPGPHALATLHELRRLCVEAGQELRELLAGLLAGGAEVSAVEDLPEAQDRGDDLIVV